MSLLVRHVGGVVVLSGALLLAACGGEDEAACGYDWEGAPCGEAWRQLFQCAPDGSSYDCYTDHDHAEGLDVWNRVGWPCECINEAGLIRDTPECGDTF